MARAAVKTRGHEPTFPDEDPKQRALANVSLRMGTDFTFPVDVAVRKLAWIGKSGSGKSWGVGLMLEQMRRAGVRFIVLDPVGTHTGVAQMDGVLFHEVQRGMHIGKFTRFILENDLNVIVNLRALSFDEQRVFVKLFTEYLYRWNKDFGPRHLVVEEVQQFAPQGGKSEAKEMLQVLSTMGRMEGIGLSVVTQRPAIVDKTVIANTDAFIFFQLMLPQDLGAVTDVLTAKTNLAPEEEAKIDRIIADMPSLPKGQVIVYSPEWLQVAERRKVNGKRVTFHSGGTPDNYVRPIGDEPGLAAVEGGDAEAAFADHADPLPLDGAEPGGEGELPPEAPLPVPEAPMPAPMVGGVSRSRAAALAVAGLLAFPVVFMPFRAVETRLRRRGQRRRAERAV